jgi:hypothetical protein
MANTGIETITIDKEGHEIILHDADEAKLAALGKKRIISDIVAHCRGDGP